MTMAMTMTSWADRVGDKKPSDGRKSEEKPKPIVCPVMLDFLKSRGTHQGYGLFEGIPEAVEFSRKITRNQMKRLKDGKVPAAFWDFLKKMKLIPWKEAMPNGGMTIGALACHLQDPARVYPSEGTRSTAHSLARIMLKSGHPDLTDRCFAVGIWRSWERHWLYRRASC